MGDHIEKAKEEINDTVREESKETRKKDDENAKLLSMRQGITDTLNEELNGKSNFWDETIKWLTDTADEIIGYENMPFEVKQKALKELKRMVDEEIVISDADKDKFRDQYFYKHSAW